MNFVDGKLGTNTQRTKKHKHSLRSHAVNNIVFCFLKFPCAHDAAPRIDVANLTIFLTFCAQEEDNTGNLQMLNGRFYDLR